MGNPKNGTEPKSHRTIGFPPAYALCFFASGVFMFIGLTGLILSHTTAASPEAGRAVTTIVNTPTDELAGMSFEELSALQQQADKAVSGSDNALAEPALKKIKLVIETKVNHP